MKTILLTGGSGFIGSHTALVLLEQGYRIVIIDSHINSSPKASQRILDTVKLTKFDCTGHLDLICGDIRDLNVVRNVFSDSKKRGYEINAVIHFAGLKAVRESFDDPLRYWDTNVLGTINLLKIMDAFNCRKLIFSSSASIYGVATDSPIKEFADIKPVNPYGSTKSAIERLLNDIFNSFSDEWSIANLRYFNPIGAHPLGLIGEDPLGMPNNIFPLINQVAAGKIKELKIYGNDWETPDGTCIRDYIHVMDLSEGHVRALQYILSNKPQLINFNLGTGKGTSILELINTFQKVNNIKIPYIFTDRRKGDTSITVADNNFATSILDWTPTRNLSDMCRDGWNWQLR